MANTYFTYIQSNKSRRLDVGASEFAGEVLQAPEQMVRGIIYHALPVLDDSQDSSGGRTNFLSEWYRGRGNLIGADQVSGRMPPGRIVGKLI